MPKLLTCETYLRGPYLHGCRFSLSRRISCLLPPTFPSNLLLPSLPMHPHPLPYRTRLPYSTDGRKAKHGAGQVRLLPVPVVTVIYSECGKLEESSAHRDRRVCAWLMTPGFMHCPLEKQAPAELRARITVRLTLPRSPPLPPQSLCFSHWKRDF